jgi:tetratricopeptide (TPR) repeat protein
VNLVIKSCICTGLCVALGSVDLGGSELASARAALDRDEYGQAVAIAERATAANPANVEAWIVLGHGLSGLIDQASLFQKADLAQRCLAAYARAATLDPMNVEAHVSLLEYYRQAPPVVGGSRAKALAQAQRLVQLDAGLGHSWLVRLAIEDNRPDDAMQTEETLLHLEPNSYRALYWLGATCVFTGKQLTRGRDALRRALQMVPGSDDPGLDEADVLLGQILEKSGDQPGAILAYKAALAVNPKQVDAKTRLARLR